MYFLVLTIIIAGAVTHIPKFIKITPIPYSNISLSDSACDIIDPLKVILKK
jgi:hypothetical protein